MPSSPSNVNTYIIHTGKRLTYRVFSYQLGFFLSVGGLVLRSDALASASIVCNNLVILTQPILIFFYLISLEAEEYF